MEGPAFLLFNLSQGVSLPHIAGTFSIILVLGTWVDETEKKLYWETNGRNLDIHQWQL